MEFVNDPWPWTGLLRGAPLTIAQVIAGGTLPVLEAAALWWTIEQGASVLVAAAAGGAGKSTLATALFAFLPDDARCYVTSGPDDRLNMPAGDGPLYLLVNELSNHMPLYLSGSAAARAFALLGEGVRLIGTLHADDAAEAVGVMHYESGISLTDISRVPVVVVLRAWAGPLGVERRVVEIGLLSPAAGQVRVATVAAWLAEERRVALTRHGLNALAAWAGVSHHEAGEAIARRARALDRLVQGADQTSEAVAASVHAVRGAERAAMVVGGGPDATT